MEEHSSETKQVRQQGPEHWEGRSQSDWDGSCVVITRKEDKGRQQIEEATGPMEPRDA